MLWRLLIVTSIVTGCTSMCGRADLDPEQVVEAYLNTAFNMREIAQRRTLVRLTTGSMKSAIENATDDMITQAYIERQYNLKSFSLVERRDRTPRETEVTFIIEYSKRDKGTQKHDPAVVRTENTVLLVRKHNLWLIQDVVNAKTSLDFPLAPESQITAKPGEITPLPPDDPQPPPLDPPPPVETGN